VLFVTDENQLLVTVNIPFFQHNIGAKFVHLHGDTLLTTNHSL